MSYHKHNPPQGYPRNDEYPPPGHSVQGYPPPEYRPTPLPPTGYTHMEEHSPAGNPVQSYPPARVAAAAPLPPPTPARRPPQQDYAHPPVVYAVPKNCPPSDPSPVNNNQPTANLKNYPLPTASPQDTEPTPQQDYANPPVVYAVHKNYPPPAASPVNNNKPTANHKNYPLPTASPHDTEPSPQLAYPPPQPVYTVTRPQPPSSPNKDGCCSCCCSIL